ncbi:unnamed protein product [Spirodela intermedia]|uniref:Uncharacterized protein n=1 Tax=Spirodela intermedia TaxID=51605 RepID=A0A811G8A4_SPIIN|nr:unnamed protein product [Spirodela intermedia]
MHPRCLTLGLMPPLWLQAVRTLTKVTSSGLTRRCLISAKTRMASLAWPWRASPPITEFQVEMSRSAMPRKTSRARSMLPHLADACIRAPASSAPSSAQADSRLSMVTSSGLSPARVISSKTSSPAITAFQETTSLCGNWSNNSRALSISPLLAYPVIITFHEIRSLQGVPSNSRRAASRSPLLAWPAIIADQATTSARAGPSKSTLAAAMSPQLA